MAYQLPNLQEGRGRLVPGAFLRVPLCCLHWLPGALLRLGWLCLIDVTGLTFGVIV